MASTHQQQSLQRKLIYIVLILVIFFGLVFYRPYLVEAKAEQLALRDQDRGDVELTGQVVKLSLTGLRGFAVTYLWYGAMEKQKKNQWNELELIVRSIIKLQPHFIKPWEFQSWNLAYNVSVQCDREADQYFYITRGIELLAEGERQNHFHPDLRHYIGFYNQHKICQADRTNMLLALYQLSCIDPNQRDPRRFGGLDPDKPGLLRNMAEFEKFCQEHPQLVRRLREKVRCETPVDVVQFLDENYRVPSLYEDVPETPPDAPWELTPGKLRRPAERFPLLPPGPSKERFDDKALTEDSQLPDEIDAFLVGRAWYSYAQEPIPEPIPEKPGESQPITNPARQRLPHYTTLLFRRYPSQAQSSVANRMENDGWFDDKGWVITKWFDKDLVVGGGRNWCVDAWSEAHRMWSEFGDRTGLRFKTPEDEKRVSDDARKFAESTGMMEGNMPPQMRDTDNLSAEQLRLLKAFRRYAAYHECRSKVNYVHFYYQSLVHSSEKAIKARKHFYQADKYREAGKRTLALAEYEHPDALPAWKEILHDNPEYANNDVKESSFETETKYLDVYRELHGRQLKQRLILLAYLGETAGPLAGGWPLLGQLARPHMLPDPELGGPLDQVLGQEFVMQIREQKAAKGRKGPRSVTPEMMDMMRQRMRTGAPPGAMEGPGMPMGRGR
jgi:hypothetical protein